MYVYVKKGTVLEDKRPSSFIKDLGKRSVALEEEKAARVPNEVLRLQKALKSLDPAEVSGAIYVCKVKNLAKDYKGLLEEAEAHLLKVQVK